MRTVLPTDVCVLVAPVGWRLVAGQSNVWREIWQQATNTTFAKHVGMIALAKFFKAPRRRCRHICKSCSTVGTDEASVYSECHISLLLESKSMESQCRTHRPNGGHISGRRCNKNRSTLSECLTTIDVYTKSNLCAAETVIVGHTS